MNGVEGPNRGDPTSLKGESPDQMHTGLSKVYTSKKAPEFQKWLQHYFGPHVTPQMVARFEQNMMQTVQNSLKHAKEQHEKVQREIKRRIEEG